MAKPDPFCSGGSSGAVGGAGQVVVELCGLSGAGLIIWSRKRFEVCTEVMVRVRAAALPELVGEKEGTWRMLRGIVVQCLAERRGDGSCGFRVCLLVVGGRRKEARGWEVDERVFVRCDWSRGSRVGLN
jgi:hypothetical protein